MNPSTASEPVSIYDRLQKDKYFSSPFSESASPSPSSPSSSAPIQNPTPRFPLLSLPAELIIRIIREVIASDRELFLSQRPHAYTLAHTCRWLNIEVSKQFWTMAVPLNRVGNLGAKFNFWPGVRGVRWGHGERVENDVWCRILHVVERGGEVWAVKCALEPWKDLSGLRQYDLELDEGG